MILVPFTKIHKRIKVTNFGHSCHIHILSHPCLIYAVLSRRIIAKWVVFEFRTIWKVMLTARAHGTKFL